MSATRSTPSCRLMPQDYVDLAVYLIMQVQDGPGRLARNVAPPNAAHFTTILHWGTRASEQRLRLLFEVLADGIFIGLFAGSGTLERNEGRVGYWQIYQAGSGDDSLIATGQLWGADGSEFGARYNLKLDHGYTRKLPGYNPELTDLLEDLIGQVDWWVQLREASAG